MPAPPAAAKARPTMFVVAQVRQALQQTVAIGACSPYLPATSATRPVQIVFTPDSVDGGGAEARAATKCGARAAAGPRPARPRRECRPGGRAPNSALPRTGS